jgi:hypothetical protein
VYFNSIFLTYFAARGWEDAHKKTANFPVMVLTGVLYLTAAFHFWMAYSLFKETILFNWLVTESYAELIFAFTITAVLVIKKLQRAQIKNINFLEIACFLVALYLPMMVGGPYHKGTPVNTDNEIGSYLQSIEHQKFRVQFIRNYALPLDIVPFHTGVLYGSRACDGFITVPLLRYSEYLSLGCPILLDIKEGKLADIKLIQLMRTGDYTKCGEPKYLDYISLKYIITENQNLPRASHYFLLFDPHIRQTLNTMGIKHYNSSPDGITASLKSPFRIAHQLWFHPRDSLEFGVNGEGEEENKLIISIKDTNNEGIEVSEPVTESLKRVTFAIPEICYGKMCSVEFKSQASNASIQLFDPAVRHAKYQYELSLNAKIKVFSNPLAIPRATLYYHYLVIKDDRQQLNFMGSDNFDPTSTLILADSPFSEEKKDNNAPPGDYEISFLEEHNDMLRFAVRTSKRSIFSLSDVFYPGWRAFVDGKPVRILRANHAFRGIPLESGEHEIVMTYIPLSFKIGLWVSLPTLFSLLCLLVTTKESFRYFNLVISRIR